MSHDEPAGDDAKLTGLSKHFNSVTNRGRANVAIATYASIAAGFLYYYFNRSRPSLELESVCNTLQKSSDSKDTDEEDIIKKYFS